jgi:hypothetical protein
MESYPMRPRPLFSFFLIPALILACTSAKVQEPLDEKHLPLDFRVEKYTQYYEIDPERNTFKSKQKIHLVNVSEGQANKIVFTLHPNLVIDHVVIRNFGGKEITKGLWSKVGVRQMARIWAGKSTNQFPVYGILTSEAIAPRQGLSFEINYHLDPGFIRDRPEEMYELTVSPTASYAIGPLTGHNPFFGRNTGAPFFLQIAHPNELYTCAPGNLISSREENRFLIDTYESKIPNIPTFSCARYKKTVREDENHRLEYYTYTDQQVTEEMVDFTFRVIDLYSKSFGDNGTREYRFATVGEANSMKPGGENKGNTIFLTDFYTRLRHSWLLNLLVNIYAGGLSGEVADSLFIGHELYHNWNLFYVHWSGELYEWFGEGGANFASAWAVEKIIDPEAGAQARKHFLKQFIRNKGWEASDPLESVEKTGNAERALMYYYGAIVWEQLRRKLGDDSFFAGLKQFYLENGFKQTTCEDLLASLQKRADFDVREFLRQWTAANPKIRLSISDVNIEPQETGFRTRVEIEVDSEKNYDVATAIGYQTSRKEALTIVPINIKGKGKYVHILDTRERPTLIQIDPHYTVPRINLDNCTWEE